MGRGRSGGKRDPHYLWHLVDREWGWGGGEGMWVRRWREGWEGWVELRGWLELRGWVCRGDVLGEEEVQALGVQWWVGKVGLG